MKALPLNALRAFEASSRLTSFKAAAAELGVTSAAISHHVKALEERLGLLLFERHHRALRITPAGTKLATVLQAAFGNIEHALAELAGAGVLAGPRKLTVSAAPTFAVKWLAPRIHRFQTLQSSLELQVLASDVLVDLTNRREVDVALRYGRDSFGAELIAHRLWEEGRVIAICAPSLTDAEIKSAEDLLRIPLLRTATPEPGEEDASAGRTISWATWLKAAGIEGPDAQIAASRGPLFGSTQLALEAAVTGRGAALAPAILVESDLATGRLRQWSDVSIPDPFSYWLLYRRDRADEPRIQAFVQWVLREAASQTGPTSSRSEMI